MKSMCHFAAKIPAPHDHSNMLKVHAGPRNPPVGQSLIHVRESYYCNCCVEGLIGFFLFSLFTPSSIQCIEPVVLQWKAKLICFC